MDFNFIFSISPVQTSMKMLPQRSMFHRNGVMRFASGNLTRIIESSILVAVSKASTK